MTTKKAASEAARALAMRRKKARHVCQECGKKFTGYLGAKYCSSTCRSRAHRKAKKESQK